MATQARKKRGRQTGQSARRAAFLANNVLSESDDEVHIPGRVLVAASPPVRGRKKPQKSTTTNRHRTPSDDNDSDDKSEPKTDDNEEEEVSPAPLRRRMNTGRGAARPKQGVKKSTVAIAHSSTSQAASASQTVVREESQEEGRREQPKKRATRKPATATRHTPRLTTGPSRGLTDSSDSEHEGPSQSATAVRPRKATTTGTTAAARKPPASTRRVQRPTTNTQTASSIRTSDSDESLPNSPVRRTPPPRMTTRRPTNRAGASRTIRYGASRRTPPPPPIDEDEEEVIDLDTATPSPAAASSTSRQRRNRTAAVVPGAWSPVPGVLRRGSRGRADARSNRSTVSPEVMQQIRQMEGDEQMARQLQAQFDQEQPPATNRRRRTHGRSQAAAATPASDSDDETTVVNGANEEEEPTDEDSSDDGEATAQLQPHVQAVFENVLLLNGTRGAAHMVVNRGAGRGRRGRGGRHLRIFLGNFRDMQQEANIGQDYDNLLRLAEQLGDAGTPKGLSQTAIDRLPLIPHRPLPVDLNSSVNPDIVSCTICMSDFVANEQLRFLPCSHRFHGGCVDQWLKSNRTCPICRFDVVEATAQVDAAPS